MRAAFGQNRATVADEGVNELRGEIAGLAVLGLGRAGIAHARGSRELVRVHVSEHVPLRHEEREGHESREKCTPGNHDFRSTGECTAWPKVAQ